MVTPKPILPALNNAATVPLPDFLAACYERTGTTIHDLCAGHNDGTFTGTISPNWRLDANGEVVALTKVNSDYWEFGTNPSAMISNVTKFTMAFRFCRTALSDFVSAHAGNSWTASPIVGLAAVNDGTITFKAGNFFYAYYNLDDILPHTFMVSFDTGVAKYYLDGADITAFMTSPFGLTTPTENAGAVTFRLGKLGASLGGNGGVAIWNGAALGGPDCISISGDFWQLTKETFGGGGATPPIVLSAVAIDQRTIKVTFDHAMLVNAALTLAANYSLNAAAGSVPRTVLSVSFDPDCLPPTSVLLTLDGEMTIGVLNYTVGVQNVQDVDGIPIGNVGNSASFNGLGIPPHLLAAFGQFIDLTHVHVRYSEAVRQVSALNSDDALNPTNYAIAPASVGPPPVTVSSVATVSPTEVVLTVVGLLADMKYNLTVINVKDVDGGNVVS